MGNAARGMTVWRKSGRCDSHQCAEVAKGDGRAAIRNNTKPDVHLTFARDDWNSFVAGVRSGAFTR